MVSGGGSYTRGSYGKVFKELSLMEALTPEDLIDRIGFNGHSTALVILGRPRERGRIHRKSTFELLWFFNVPRG